MLVVITLRSGLVSPSPMTPVQHQVRKIGTEMNQYVRGDRQVAEHFYARLAPHRLATVAGQEASGADLIDLLRGPVLNRCDHAIFNFFKRHKVVVEANGAGRTLLRAS